MREQQLTPAVLLQRPHQEASSVLLAIGEANNIALVVQDLDAHMRSASPIAIKCEGRTYLYEVAAEGTPTGASPACLADSTWLFYRRGALFSQSNVAVAFVNRAPMPYEVHSRPERTTSTTP